MSIGGRVLRIEHCQFYYADSTRLTDYPEQLGW
jgi:hypothetical protein